METQRLCGKLVSNEGFANAQSESDTDRKSTRLNSSHSQISYAVFCLKKKNSGTPPVPSIYAGLAGLGIIEQPGVAHIARHVGSLTKRLAEGCDDIAASAVSRSPGSPL